MVNLVFLDSCIFFDCIENPRNKTCINHAVNLGFHIVSSITVLGETIEQMRDHSERDRYIPSFLSLLDEWKVFTYYPDSFVAEICYRLANLEIDYRVEKTDRVHLGYAIAYSCSFFLTSDTNLQKYRIPHALEEAGFFKPETISIEEFKERMK